MESFRRIVSDYLTDTSVSFQDRSFIVFSNLVLIALYVAIPFGIIMREPLSATVSTIVGAIAFCG